MKTDPLKNVVLIGGGHAHTLVLNGLKARPLSNAQVIVINPGKTAPYSGMLPGFVAGHYERGELDIDLGRLSQKVDAVLVDDRAISIDIEKKFVRLSSGKEIFYDIASVDVGITSHMPNLPGFSDHGIPAKPLENFANRWDQYRSSYGAKSIVIIGGGIAGAELGMAMSFALRSDANSVSVKIFDRGQVLSSNSATARRHVLKELESNGVEVIEHTDVVEISGDGVSLSDDQFVASDFVVGAAGATPHPWIGGTGLKLHEGFIEVDQTLQSSAPGVFAVGDCAHLSFDPRPKAGVYAVRQAPVLLNNLRRMLKDEELQKYAPQSDYLKLVSLGGKRAFGEKFGRGMSGHLVWRLKNHIERSFMTQF